MSISRTNIVHFETLAWYQNVIYKMARPKRLERLTHSLEGCCSIQLSYGRTRKHNIKLNALKNKFFFTLFFNCFFYFFCDIMG